MSELIETVKKCGQEVVEEMGTGYKEGPYEEALAHEFRNSEVPYERQKNREVIYKGHSIGTTRIDLVVDNSLIVECKALKNLKSRHRNQVRAYFETTNLDSGILLNFPKYGEEIEIEKIDYPSELELENGEEFENNFSGTLNEIKEAADEVCKILGTQFAYRGDKKIYKNALKTELRDKGITYTKRTAELLYKNQVLKNYSNLMIDQKYLLDLKLDEKIEEDTRENLMSDLKLHDIEKGLIINFPSDCATVTMEKVEL